MADDNKTSEAAAAKPVDLDSEIKALVDKHLDETLDTRIVASLDGQAARLREAEDAKSAAAHQESVDAAREATRAANAHAKAAAKAEREATEAAKADFDDVRLRRVASRADLLAALGEDETPLLMFETGESFAHWVDPVPVPLTAATDNAPVTNGEMLSFAAEARAAVLDAVWLVAPSASMRCEIAGGLGIGGGRDAQIPKGFLAF